MASTAEILGDAPAPLNGTSLDPYGQLLKMLLPRMVEDMLRITVDRSFPRIGKKNNGGGGNRNNG